MIVEGFVDFDYEITQLTVRHIGGTSFLEPVGHVQVDGDYRESWQPQAMNPVAKERHAKLQAKSRRRSAAAVFSGSNCLLRAKMSFSAKSLPVRMTQEWSQ